MNAFDMPVNHLCVGNAERACQLYFGLAIALRTVSKFNSGRFFMMMRATSECVSFPGWRFLNLVSHGLQRRMEFCRLGCMLPVLVPSPSPFTDKVQADRVQQCDRNRHPGDLVFPPT